VVGGSRQWWEAAGSGERQQAVVGGSRQWWEAAGSSGRQ
jgi:hypothetical protein